MGQNQASKQAQADQARSNADSASALDESKSESLLAQLLKKATKFQGLLAAYLTSVALTLGGLGFLGYNSDVLGGREIMAGIFITLLPLFAILISHTIPRWRMMRREHQLKLWAIEGSETRPGYFRIGCYEDNEKDRKDFNRADQAHEEVHDWISGSSLPLLFLTGASGAGKSSLLNAYVTPTLREGTPRYRVITLRSIDDPLERLREALLTPDVIWKNLSQVDRQAVMMGLLSDATGYLDKRDEKLLVVFDQFEELLILHGSEAPKSSNDEGPPSRPSVVDKVKQLLQAIHQEPVPGLCVLLSLRTDYEGMLGLLELPPLEQGTNWFKVSPFTKNASRRFLAGGFKRVGENSLDSLMAEAATVEETRGLIRPITLNMLGALMSRMEGRFSKGKRGGLLTSDLRQVLAEPRWRDHASLILKPMLTDASTRQPRSIKELAKETGFAAESIEGCLLHLYDQGLVRRLNRAQSIPDRVWEISHDFVAKLLSNMLHTPVRSFGRRLSSIALPTSIVAWLLVFIFLLPSYIRGIPNRAADQLRNQYGAKVNRPDQGGWIVDLSKLEITTLDQIAPSLRDLGLIKSLDLGDCTSLENVDGLKGLSALQELDLSGTSLENVDGLKGLSALQELYLIDCESLENIDGLKGMSALQKLDLEGCKLLENIDGLKGMSALQKLDLEGCKLLENIDGLKGMSALQKLDLSGTSLENVDGLKGLSALQELYLIDCESLENIDGLKGMSALQVLYLRGTSLANIDGLKGMSALQVLYLRGTSLANIDGLKGMSALQKLDLSDCESLENVDGLKGMSALQLLYLGGCKSLENVDGLKGMSALQQLDLSGTLLENVDGLKGLSALQQLDLSGTLLENVDGLKGLSALQELYLRGCKSLENIDGLKGMSALQLLILGGCTSLTDFSPLSELTELKYLNLTDCHISDLKVLHQCKSLKELWLDRAKAESPEGKTLKLKLPQAFIKSHLQNIDRTNLRGKFP